MHTLARRIRERQDAAVELYELLEEDPPWLSVRIGYSDDSAEQGALARAALGVELNEQRTWRDRSGYLPLREWIQGVEGLGVLVMQDGSMPVEQMRGFAAIHDTVPAIVINTNDDPRARVFTLIHELGRLLPPRVGTVTEGWLDELASNVLMPRDSFVGDFEYFAGDLLDSVDDIALQYGVTPKAAAVRVARLRLAPQASVDEVLEAIEERAARARDRSTGGNYYLNIISRLGPAFIELVFSALDIQALSYPAAAGLLGVKVNNFAKLRQRTSQRADT